MGVQNSYNYSTPKGIPGGLYDQSAHVVDTRINEAENGVLRFGMGVMQGSSPGSNITIPAAGGIATKFEGVAVNGFTQQQDLEGKVSLNKNQSVGVLRHGRIYARLAPEVSPAYGDTVHLVVSGDHAGLFTNTENAENTIPIHAKYIGGKGSGAVAAIELYPGE